MSATTEKAILAGGCFWGMQDLIRKRPGVLSTRVGYTGGDVANATYRNHGTHAEAIEVTFDPSVTSYRDILEFFFQIHDPTTRTARATNGVELPLGDLLQSRGAEAGGRGHHRRRRGLGTLARQGRDGGRALRGRSGRRSPSTRTTWSTIRTGTRATSPGRVGSCPIAATRWPGRAESWPTKGSTQTYNPAGPDASSASQRTGGGSICAAARHAATSAVATARPASTPASTPGGWPRHRPELRARRGLVLGLHHRPVLRGPRAGGTGAPPARPADPGSRRPRPCGLAAAPPLTRGPAADVTAADRSRPHPYSASRVSGRIRAVARHDRRFPCPLSPSVI